MTQLLHCLSLLLLAGTSAAQDSSTSASSTSATPTATLDQATVSGVSTSGVHKFLGIPYASPPVNELRFSPPMGISSYNGSINAQNFGSSCPQQNASLVSQFFHNIFHRRGRFGISGTIEVDQTWTGVDFNDASAPPESEDCNFMFHYALWLCMTPLFTGLTLNIMRPDNANSSSNLPVVVVSLFWDQKIQSCSNFVRQWIVGGR